MVASLSPFLPPAIEQETAGQPESLEVDAGSTPGATVTVEYPTMPSIPSLMMAVSEMIEKRPALSYLLPFEEPDWPAEERCLQLLTKQLQEVRKALILDCAVDPFLILSLSVLKPCRKTLEKM